MKYHELILAGCFPTLARSSPLVFPLLPSKQDSSRRAAPDFAQGGEFVQVFRIFSAYGLAEMGMDQHLEYLYQ